MSSLESLSCRVPILDGEYYSQWKYKMLELFDEFHLRKYIKNPYVPPIDPLHPTHEEEIYMLCNLRTVNLIIRGLPRIVWRLVREIITTLMALILLVGSTK